ncbi:unnamed protein product [Scytosiphon promiscuus]
MAGDAGRIRKELAECARDTDSGVTAVPKGDSLASLEGTILGPEGTPFEGGTFSINIDIPSGYPFEPPRMKFVTKIWHPNISSQTGAICLDILKDQWSPALTIKTALLSLQALMCSPEPDDPQVCPAGLDMEMGPLFATGSSSKRGQYEAVFVCALFRLCLLLHQFWLFGCMRLCSRCLRSPSRLLLPCVWRLSALKLSPSLSMPRPDLCDG